MQCTEKCAAAPLSHSLVLQQPLYCEHPHSSSRGQLERMDFASILSLLAQTGRRIEIREPPISPETIWLIGAVLFACWLFAMGACVGSFLNVVVYRVPAKISLISPGSRCPRCLHPIRWQHNIPIIGWLILRGRCADCQLPIARRYPQVELLIATIFLVVGAIELIGNGINLPRPPKVSANNSGDFALHLLPMHRAALTTKEPQALGAAVAMHLALITTLIGAALIDFDRHVIPKRITFPVIVFAMLVPLIWPDVHPVLSGFSLSELPPELRREWQAGLLDALAGAFAGLVAAGVIYAAVWLRPWLVQLYGGPITLLWIAIGLVVGWQLIPWLLVCWAVHYWLAMHPNRDLTTQPLLPARGLAIVVLVSLLGWRFIAGYPGILDAGPISQAIIMGLMVTAAWILLLAAARTLPQDYSFPQPISESMAAAPPVVEPSLSSDEPPQP